MSTRLNYRRLAPELYKSLGALSRDAGAGLDHILVDLVKTRAFQINGCAFCIDMHTKALRQAGETEQRIYLLNAWRETSLYTEQERAALAWTEAVTRLTNGDVPDEVFEQARAHFSETELVHLTYVVATINTWNRLAISFRPQVVPDRPVTVEAAAG